MKYHAINICPKSDSGLCNQLYSLINCICHCMNDNINILFIDKFYKSINTNNYCNISEIMNMNYMNNYLSMYNIFLVDSKNFTFHIENAYLISEEKNEIYDVTNNVNIFLHNNYFYISSNTILNFIPNDDTFLLKIKFIINNGFFYEIQTIKNKMLIENILYDFNNLYFHAYSVVGYKSKYFWDILKNIQFTDEYISNAQLIKNNININNSLKINCIHLRIENDLIDSYSKIFNLDYHLIKNIFENYFIFIINQMISKEDLTIILTSETDNNVIKYLTNNNYFFQIIPKLYNDRELNAIIDLEVGQICNNMLIIVFESSFSYTLKHKIKNNVQLYEVSLENFIKDYINEIKNKK
jgi:hypothetical protein